MNNHMKIETITPDTAREMLERNTANRSKRPWKIKRFSTAMLEGRWMLNGETIKISMSGRLLDGQHRLEAVVASNVTIKSYIVRDLPEEVYPSIDTGSVRTGTDILRGKEAYASLLSSAANYIHSWSHQQLGNEANFILDKDCLPGLIDAHPGMRESVAVASGVSKSVGYPGLVTALHYIFGRHCSERYRVDAFFGALSTGADLDRQSPILHLRNFLLNQKASRSKRAYRDVLALYILAWNAHITNHTMGVLRWRPNVEPFPELVPLDSVNDPLG